MSKRRTLGCELEDTVECIVITAGSGGLWVLVFLCERLFQDCYRIYVTHLL